MISRRCVGYVVLLGLAAWTGSDPDARAADGPPSARGPSPLAATQLSVRQGRKQYQATAVAKGGDTLTIVTAAHCIADDEEGQPIRLVGPAGVLQGRVVAVARNPDYRPVRSRDQGNDSVRGTLAVDSAVATVKVDLDAPSAGGAFRAIRPAELVGRPVLTGDRQTIPVHIVDRGGTEHVVKAGNHLNPKCLAWGGQGYRPTPGDSGAGVFVVLRAADGTSQPLLIGNVALLDSRGGIAPLVSLRSRWIAAALVDDPSADQDRDGPSDGPAQ